MMKIGQELRKQLDTSRKNKQKKVSEHNSFHRFMQSRTRMPEQQTIQQKMDDIENQGERIARFRTFRELAAFKRLVKAFMQEVAKNGFDLQQSHSFQLDGGNRQFMLVKEVDKKLVELTDELMHQEQKSVHLLDIIGEIKGLLVDLAF